MLSISETCVYLASLDLTYYTLRHNFLQNPQVTRHSPPDDPSEGLKWFFNLTKQMVKVQGQLEFFEGYFTVRRVCPFSLITHFKFFLKNKSDLNEY